MTRAGDHFQARLAAEQPLGLTIHLHHDGIVGAHDQKRGGGDLPECGARQVWATSPRDHGGDPRRESRRHDQGCGCAGAGAEYANGELRNLRPRHGPSNRFREPVGQEIDVEHVASVVRLGRCEQIEQQRGDPTIVQRAGHRDVSGR